MNIRAFGKLLFSGFALPKLAFRESNFLPEPKPKSLFEALRSKRFVRRMGVGLVLVMGSTFAALQVSADPVDTGANSVEDFSLQTFSAGLLPTGSQPNPANGSGSANLSSSSGISPTDLNNYSIQLWVKPSAASAAQGNPDNKIVVNLNNKFAISLRNGNWEYFIGNGSGWSHSNVDSGVRASTAWTHLQLDFNNRFVDFYVNGIKAHNTIENRNSGSGDGGNFTLGAWAVGNNGSFQGEIDEVKIWNGWRGGIVNTDMHTRANTISDSALLAYWDFNEPSGTTIYDRKGSKNLTALRDASMRLDVKQVASVSGGDTVVTFPRTYLPGVGNWTVPASATAFRTLVVAGGGSSTRGV